VSTINSDDFSKIQAQIAELRAFIAPVLLLAIRKKSRKDQAKAAGCCTKTLRNREKRLAAKMRLEGVK
jgi:predicted deacetylase